LDNISRELVLNLLKLIENKKIVKEQWWKLPKWYIFRWKPWLWKTSIMKALTKKASEKIVIFSITRKDYTSAWVWEWERRIAELLKAIQKYWEKENVHCIIFFDEFESIWRKREDTHEVHATELNELLRFLDWLSSSDNITFIAWTNAEIADLDLAITRWWRCNDIIEFKEPDKDLINQYLTKRLKSLLEKWIFSSEIIEDENIFSECLWFSYADLNTIITDLINKRALDFLLWKNYAIDAKMFKEKILEYKKNKWIWSNNKIGFI
jgi:SpoVK/Ycf46/Vps4 family AAA+-type ATPase